MKITCQSLIKEAKQQLPLMAAAIHPVTVEALSGVIEAAKQKLITPILVGPEEKIKRAAEKLNADISMYELISVEHSHAAAEISVKLARTGKAEMLIKGSLHTDEFLSPILNKEYGLRTDRRMSHVFVAEIPSYHKLLLLTDCAINILPNLMEKRDIVQNAIELAIAIGIKTPKVGIVSAVETVTDKIPSTVDAAALCKMAEREQIIGGILDGPLAFDNVISLEAAKIKNITSAVSGEVDILLLPSIETGNILAKQLEYLAQAKLAGIVLGAKVPIVLTSRADHANGRLISCAIAKIYKNYLSQKLWSKLYLS